MAMSQTETKTFTFPVNENKLVDDTDWIFTFLWKDCVGSVADNAITRFISERLKDTRHSDEESFEQMEEE